MVLRGWHQDDDGPDGEEEQASGGTISGMTGSRVVKQNDHTCKVLNMVRINPPPPPPRRGLDSGNYDVEEPEVVLMENRGSCCGGTGRDDVNDQKRMLDAGLQLNDTDEEARVTYY